MALAAPAQRTSRATQILNRYYLWRCLAKEHRGHKVLRSHAPPKLTHHHHDELVLSRIRLQQRRYPFEVGGHAVLRNRPDGQLRRHARAPPSPSVAGPLLWL